MLAELQKLPELRDVASDQQVQGLRAMLVFDRDTASRLGITPSTIDQTLYDAYGQRQVSTMFTQLNQYHVVLEVKPGLRAEPAGPARPVHPHRHRAIRRRSTGVVSGGIFGASVASGPPTRRLGRRQHRRPRLTLHGRPSTVFGARHCVRHACFPTAARCRSARSATWR